MGRRDAEHTFVRGAIVLLPHKTESGFKIISIDLNIGPFATKCISIVRNVEFCTGRKNQTWSYNIRYTWFNRSVCEKDLSV